MTGRFKTALEVPGFEPGASHMRSERSTTELHPHGRVALVWAQWYRGVFGGGVGWGWGASMLIWAQSDQGLESGQVRMLSHTVVGVSVLSI